MDGSRPSRLAMQTETSRSCQSASQPQHTRRSNRLFNLLLIRFNSRYLLYLPDAIVEKNHTKSKLGILSVRSSSFWFLTFDVGKWRRHWFSFLTIFRYLFPIWGSFFAVWFQFFLHFIYQNSLLVFSLISINLIAKLRVFPLQKQSLCFSISSCGLDSLTEDSFRRRIPFVYTIAFFFSGRMLETEPDLDRERQ